MRLPWWCHASHTHAIIQSAVDCSLHPVAPVALSLVLHLFWVSVEGMKRVFSPILSALACCCHRFPGRSVSVRWCLSGAWPPPAEALCPKVANEPWYREMRAGAVRSERWPCVMYALVACISSGLLKACWAALILLWKVLERNYTLLQTKISCIIAFTSSCCSQASFGDCACYLCSSRPKNKTK